MTYDPREHVSPVPPAPSWRRFMDMMKARAAGIHLEGCVIIEEEREVKAALRSEAVCRHCSGFDRTLHQSGVWMFACCEGYGFMPAERFETKPEPARCLLRSCVVIIEELTDEQLLARLPRGPGALDILIRRP